MIKGPGQGPKQVPPQPASSSLEEQKKERQKKFIEDMLSGHTEKCEYCFDVLFKKIGYAVRARIDNQVIKEYGMNPEASIEKYKINSLVDEKRIISLDISEVAKYVWIPKQILEDDFLQKKVFCLLDADEVNAFSDLYFENNLGKEGNMEKDSMIRKIILCRGKEDTFVGEKRELFLHDKEWRELAIEYSLMLLTTIKDDNQNMINMNVPNLYVSLYTNGGNEYTKEQRDCLQAIDFITELYLKEVV